MILSFISNNGMSDMDEWIVNEALKALLDFGSFDRGKKKDIVI